MSLFNTADKQSSNSSINKDNENIPLILHPLMQMFMNLKWKTVTGSFHCHLMFQIILLLAVTMTGVHYVKFSSCVKVSDVEDYESYLKKDMKLEMYANVTCYRNDHYQMLGKFKFINQRCKISTK